MPWAFGSELLSMWCSSTLDQKKSIWPVSEAGLRSLARISPTLGYLAKLLPIYEVESHYFLSDIPVYNKTMIGNHI